MQPTRAQTLIILLLLLNPVYPKRVCLFSFSLAVNCLLPLPHFTRKLGKGMRVSLVRCDLIVSLLPLHGVVSNLLLHWHFLSVKPRSCGGSFCSHLIGGLWLWAVRDGATGIAMCFCAVRI